MKTETVIKLLDRLEEIARKSDEHPLTIKVCLAAKRKIEELQKSVEYLKEVREESERYESDFPRL